MLDFPTVTHPIVVGIGIVDVRTVLSLLETVRQTVSIGIGSRIGDIRGAQQIFLNSTVEVSDVFTGLKDARNADEHGPEHQGGNDGYVCHLIVTKTHDAYPAHLCNFCVALFRL